MWNRNSQLLNRSEWSARASTMAAPRILAVEGDEMRSRCATTRPLSAIPEKNLFAWRGRAITVFVIGSRRLTIKHAEHSRLCRLIVCILHELRPFFNQRRLRSREFRRCAHNQSPFEDRIDTWQGLSSALDGGGHFNPIFQRSLRRGGGESKKLSTCLQLRSSFFFSCRWGCLYRIYSLVNEFIEIEVIVILFLINVHCSLIRWTSEHCNANACSFNCVWSKKLRSSWEAQLNRRVVYDIIFVQSTCNSRISLTKQHFPRRNLQKGAPSRGHCSGTQLWKVVKTALGSLQVALGW